MSAKTLDRARLLAMMAPPAAGPAMKATIEAALVALGWGSKQAFTRDEVLALTVHLAQAAQAQLAGSADPDARAAAGALAPAVDLAARTAKRASEPPPA